MIAVTAQGYGMEASVDPRFGRAEYFVFYDPQTKDYHSRENPASRAAGGAGVNAAQFLARHGVKVLVTGSVGPKAQQALAAAGIEAYTGASGTVSQAVEAYQAGRLQRL